MFIHKIGKIAYKILGPDLSTQVAHSPIGRFIFKVLNPGKDEFSIYQTDYGLKIKLSRDEAQNFGIAYLGVINPHESLVLKKIVKPDDVFIDIGAYVDGWYTLLAAKLVGDRGKVYSLEPLYTQRLKENIDINNFKNVVVDSYAVSDRNGQAQFYVKQGASSLIKDQDAAEEVEVNTITLSDYIKLRNIQKVDFIKIDVEGMELAVLHGCSDILLPEAAPDLIIEVIDSQLELSGTNKEELLNYLKGFGYKPYAFTEDGLTLYKGKYEGFNLYFSKRDIGL